MSEKEPQMTRKCEEQTLLDVVAVGLSRSGPSLAPHVGLAPRHSQVAI